RKEQSSSSSTASLLVHYDHLIAGRVSPPGELHGRRGLRVLLVAATVRLVSMLVGAVGMLAGRELEALLAQPIGAPGLHQLSLLSSVKLARVGHQSHLVLLHAHNDAHRTNVASVQAVRFLIPLVVSLPLLVSLHVLSTVRMSRVPVNVLEIWRWSAILRLLHSHRI
ncbi:hypothetical protein PENTCL1PPCAC_5501, partial [Pristionchus entomophagus]